MVAGMKTHLRLLPVVAALALGPIGCVTNDVQGPPPATQADVLYLREEIRRLNAKLEASESELGRIHGEFASSRSAQPGYATAAQAQSLQTQIDDMQRQVRAIDAARVQDKKDLYDDIAKKVAEIVNAARPRAPAAAARPAGPQTGYEHVVQSGESLSKIAAAYKVTTASIVQANNLKNADSIFAGQKLFIPD
jgi:LysM repeat protein